MGWLSRTFRPADENAAQGAPPVDAGSVPSPVPTAPTAAPDPASDLAHGAAAADAPLGVGPSASPASGSPTSGRYGPLVSVTRFDTAAPELEWQLPLNGELYRLMPGSDRPDYSLLVLERPLHFYPQPGLDLARVEPELLVEDRKGRRMVRVHALLLCARFVGQQLHPGMTDLAVNLAYVVDNSLARDASVDFGKIHVAGTGYLSEGHVPRPGGPSAESPAQGGTPVHGQSPAPAAPAEPAAPATPAPARADEPKPEPEDSAGDEPGTRHTSSDVLDELADALRRGVEQERGEPVRRMTAVLTVDPEGRLSGLSGNADGRAPVPTPDTFGRIAEVLARLAEQGGTRIAAVTVRVDGDTVEHEVTRTHD